MKRERRSYASDRSTSVVDMSDSNLWTPLRSYVSELTGDPAGRIPRAADVRAFAELLSTF